MKHTKKSLMVILILTIMLFLITSCGFVSASGDVDDVSPDLDGDMSISTDDVDLIETDENYFLNGKDYKSESLSSSGGSDSSSPYNFTTSFYEFNYGDDIIISAKLTDSKGAPVSSKKVSNTIKNSNNKITNLTDKEGKVSFNFSNLNLGPGLYSYVLTMDKTNDYNFFVILNNSMAMKNPRFVYSNLTTTSVSSVDGRSGDYFVYTLTDEKGNPLADELVQIGFNGVIYYRITNETGSVSLQINLNHEGYFPFIAYYGGNGEYNPIVANGLITVGKQTPKLFGENTTYYIYDKVKKLNAYVLTKNNKYANNVNVTFKIGSHILSAVTGFKEGDEDLIYDAELDETNYPYVAYVDVANLNLDVGTYTVYISINNDLTFNDVTSKFTLNIIDSNSILKVLNNTITSVYGDLNVQFTGEKGNAISNRLISAKINGQTFTGKTDSDGIASINTGTIPAGNYNAYISFAGDKSYKSTNLTKQVKVIKSNTSLEATTLLFDYEDSKILPIKLLDPRGNGISERNVYLTIMKYDGDTIYPSAITNEDGIANFDLSVLDAGLWIVFGNFTGDDVYEASNFTDKFVAVKYLTSTIIEDIPNSSIGLPIVIHSSVISANGLYVNAGNIHFYVDNNLFYSIDLKNWDYNSVHMVNTNNKTLMKIKMDSDGDISVEYIPSSSGKHVLKAVYDGTDYYKGSESSIDFTVGEDSSGSDDKTDKQIYVNNADIDLQASGNAVNITLTDGKGKAIPNAKIKIVLNKISSNLNTDNNGKAFVKVNPNSTLKVVYVDSNGASVSASIVNTVLDTVYMERNRTATKIIYQNMTTTSVNSKVDGRIGKDFEVTLLNNKGKALANKTVYIGFNGRVYERQTDEYGGAKLQINLGYEGSYTFAIAFLGDDNYTGSFEVAIIKVNKQAPKLTATSKTYKTSTKTKSLSATFKSANGNPISGKKISFTVNGKTYTATTNAKGIATVNVSLNNKGTYSFTAKYAGDGMYKATSASGKLTIK